MARKQRKAWLMSSAFSVFHRREIRDTAKCSREMCLVSESGRSCNFRQGPISFSQLLSRELYAKLSHVFCGRSVEEATKGLRQIDGMDPDFVSNRFDRN